MVEVSDDTQGSSTATGNAYSAAASRHDADMRSYQETQGQVVADTRLDVASNSGETTSLTTTATGNFQVGLATVAALAADATVRAVLLRVPASGA